jgi:ABC-type hemin transport system ATPase subunit
VRGDGHGDHAERRRVLRRPAAAPADRPRALAGRPRVLLLDEATSALDNVAQRVITHDLADLGMVARGGAFHTLASRQLL